MKKESRIALMASGLMLMIVSVNISTQAQELTQTIRGTIIDQQSGQPLFAANVVVLTTDPMIGTTSDVDGNFRLEGVPVGRHTLKATFLGYEGQTIPEVYIGSAKEVILTIKLKESFVTMDAFEVKASREGRDKPINEMVMGSAQSFTVEETKRYAASFEDPGRAVASFAGVNGSGDDGTNEIVIRGNSPRGVLWRVEGIEVPNPNHFAEDGASAGAVSMLSTNVLDNSDFLTGAFSAEYGNALSGVFDINLRTGNNEKREYAFQAGILGVGLAAEGPFADSSRSSYLLNYRYSTLALFDNIGVPIAGDQEDIIFHDLSFKLHFPTEKMGIFSVWGLGGGSTFQYKGAGIETDENDSIILEDPFNEKFTNKAGATGITHKYYFNNKTYLRSTVAYTANEIRYDEDSLGLSLYYRQKFANTSIRTSFLLNKKWDARNTIRVGAIGSHLQFDLYSQYRDHEQGDVLTTDLDRSGGSQLLQGYGQWQHRLRENITFNVGLHYTYFVLNSNQAFEPRLGASWQATSRHQFTAAFGMHSRMESMSVYQAHELDENGSKVYPNRNLDFTRARHYVLGHTFNFTEFLRLKTELYYQELYDVPIRPVSNNPQEQIFSSLNARDGYSTMKALNNGTGSNYGVEVTLERFLSKGYYYLATASIYESKYRGADNVLRDTRFNANVLANFIAGKEYKVGKMKNNLLGFNTRVFFAGGKRVVPIDLEASITEGETVRNWDQAWERKLDDYWRIDAGVTYRRNRPKHSSVWSLNIQNITNRENPYSEYFNSETGKVETNTQLGMLPIMSYRIEF